MIQNENSSRIGPKPPPPPNDNNNSNTRPPLLPKKIQPDPDYEVIEFGGQQYSNAGTQLNRVDSSQNKPGINCNLCGSAPAAVKCDQCPQPMMCPTCDDMYHRHPKRSTHTRKVVSCNNKIKQIINTIFLNIIHINSIVSKVSNHQYHQKVRDRQYLYRLQDVIRKLWHASWVTPFLKGRNRYDIASSHKITLDKKCSFVTQKLIKC